MSVGDMRFQNGNYFRFAPPLGRRGRHRARPTANNAAAASYFLHPNSGYPMRLIKLSIFCAATRLLRSVVAGKQGSKPHRGTLGLQPMIESLDVEL